MTGVGYHVAPAAAREYIAQEGLVASGPNPRWAKYGLAVQPSGVYVWATFSRALDWALDFARLVRCPAAGVSDVWAVRLDGHDVHEDPVLGPQGALYVAESVAPERLTLRLGAVTCDI